MSLSSLRPFSLSPFLLRSHKGYHTNMPSSSLLLNNLFPSTMNKPSTDLHFYSPTRKLHYNSMKCKASSINSYDLYDLLGVDSSSDQSQIKTAYRSLQKRCHPDIAGPAGHDMAIILNEVYSILSDPNSRSAYDREHFKSSEFKGYTGKPLYSTWFGSENEQRAVFVDEVKCVGCLKCALFAEKTFAIESVYGRARVIAQWADPEDKINEAIQACPVDCISMVEKSKLAALEFLMSKLPRGSVRVGASNAVRTSVSNIFVEANKFESRFHEMNEKGAKQNSTGSDLHREARFAAMQAIRSISNFWYWQSPKTATQTTETNLSLIHIVKKTTGPNTDRLREAAARRQAGEPMGSTSQNPSSFVHDDLYWTPRLILPPPASASNTTSSGSLPIRPKATEEETIFAKKEWQNPMTSKMAVAMGFISAIVVGSEGEGIGGHLEEHIGGSMALQIVNSSWLQIFLAGVTWYFIGVAGVGMVDDLEMKKWGVKDQSER